MSVRVLTVVLTVLAFVAGCGGSRSGGPSSPGPRPLSQQPTPPLVIDITISGGSVKPTNGEFNANARQPIELRVNSDVVDELHVHSVPDHTFPVEAKPNQTFQFTVDVPGRVEVELHHLHRTVATIQVQQ